MNQRVLFHFEMLNNDKYFQFSSQPGVNFDEIDSVLDVFKVKFAEMKAAAVESENKAKEEAAAKEAESAPLEAEAVSA